MSDENLNQEEKDLSKSPDGSESEDALDDLFKSDDDSQDELEDSEKVKKLEERLGNIEKGVKKFFSENGRKQKETEKQPEKKEEVIETKSPVHSVLKTLYFDKHPEAQDYWEQVEKEAKLLGKDPFELYESSTYLKGEAKARHDAKIEEETNKKKIDTPSNGTGTPKKNITDIKPEDVEKLKPSEKAEWVKAQARKEREQDE